MEITRAVARTLSIVYTKGLGEVIYLHGVHRWGNDRWSAEAWCCACKRGRACPDPGKHPLIIPRVQEHGSLDGCATRREAERRYTSLPPRATNIGIVVAPGMLVLDIDPRNDGHNSLAQLELEHGPLPRTLSAHTGGGGAHLWWSVPARFADAARSTGVDHGGWRASIGPGLDIKTAGGYVVAPPSRHRNGGRRYSWRPGNTHPSEAPTWLYRTARREAEQTARVPRRSVRGEGRTAGLATWMARAAPGQRGQRLFDALCWAMRSDQDIDPIIEAAAATGLSMREINGRVASARRNTRG